MTQLTRYQELALDVALKSHNIVICGQAGTGKSFVLKYIVNALQARGKRVAVTATTGIASRQFSQFGAVTFHSWAGLLDGRYSSAELKRLIETDEKFQAAHERMCNTDCLVLDEMSMLSSRLFEVLEDTCRAVRKTQTPFGGMQVIFAGDFYQLPPVKNALYNEDGKFCFASDRWSKVFPHIVELTEVLRQDERPLIMAINEAAFGHLSRESCNVLAKLNRPLQCPPGQKVVKLYATNHQVDVENTNSVLEMAGELITYKAKDDGEKKHLQGILAPRILHLKRGCPVMLLRNLSTRLVNGSLGEVVDFGEDGPIVHFNDADITMEVKEINFSVFNPQLKCNVAVRTQVPLKPAFAMTIHKSQGMTLKYVSVECYMINRPGQLGVAIGRAKSLEGLEVKHFHPSCCVLQPDEVRNFYGQLKDAPMHLHTDLIECCQSVIATDDDPTAEVLPGPLEDPSDDINDVDSDDIAQATQDVEDAAIVEEVYALPAAFDVPAFLKPLMLPMTHTPRQEEVNCLLEEWGTCPSFASFLAWERSHVQNLVKRHLAPGMQATQKEQSSLYADLTRHLQSTEHKAKCSELLEGATTSTDPVYQGIFLVMEELRRQEVETMAMSMIAEPKILTQMVRQLPSQANLTDGARGKIRYLAGYCIAKRRFQLQQQTSRLVFRLEKKCRDRMTNSHKKVILLASLTRTEVQIQTSCVDKGSLQETTRRQNINRGLIHVSDETFYFFFHLCDTVIQLQSPANLQKYGAMINDFILRKVEEDDTLKQEFLSLFSSCDDYSEAFALELFTEVTSLFCRVMVKQMRKDYLSAMKKTKGMAHRKKVLMGSGVGKKRPVKGTPVLGNSTRVITFSDIIADTSAGKEDSHKKLLALAKESNLKSVKCKKAEWQTLCRAYSVPNRMQDTIPTIISKLEDKIPTLAAMEDVGVVGGGPATEETPPLRRASKRRAGAGDLDNICRDCQQVYVDGEPWIQCSECNRWFHRECAEVFDEDEWDEYSRGELEFVCSYC